MPNVLIVPLPEAGHLVPTLPLARDLITRGMHVTYLTLPRFAKVIEQLPAAVVPLFNAYDPLADTADPWYHFLCHYAGEAGLRRFSALLDRHLDFNAIDFLLCDRSMLRRHRSLLFSRVSPRRAALFSTSLFDWDEYDQTWERPMIVLCPQTLEVVELRRAQPHVFYAAPGTPPPSEQSAAPASRESRQLVLVTFGSQAMRYPRLKHVIERVAEVAKQRNDLRFLCALGAQTPSLMPCLPQLRNLEITTYIDQQRLLTEAVAHISHGGLSSVKESIEALTPIVVTPMLYDQYFNGMRVRRLGLGEAMFDEAVTVGAMNRSLDACLEGRFEASLHAMQKDFKLWQQQHPACAYVEGWLEDKEPVTPTWPAPPV